jgi:uncharacterized coiled-coil DUF342 family protein
MSLPRRTAMTDTLDSAIKARLRAVLDGQSVTEMQLRRLFEEGQACALILQGQLENVERRLSELASEPDSSIAELAATFRRANELRPDREELNELLADLDARAREFRTSWLSPS